jgi:hypothetical protein
VKNIYFTRKPVKSFLHHYPEFFVDLYLVNVENKDRVVGISDRVRIHEESVHFKNISEKRNYCTNRRNYLMYSHNRDNSDVIMWMDADSICRKRSDEWLHIIQSEEHDVIFYGWDGYPLGGVISVRKGIGGSLFLQKYYNAYSQDSYLSSSRDTWMLNQNCIKPIVKNNPSFKYQYLKHPFYDSKLKDDAYIWLPIHRKDKDKYLQECKFYIDLEK